MVEPQKIGRDTPLPETLDFGGLLAAGMGYAQALSGAVWTDFNEHDPGVTILEALCYALTDLGYRTAHPIEDLLASSSAALGLSTDDQPLFTGDRILVTAPVTESDIVALLLGNLPKIKTVWLDKVAGLTSTYDVYLETYAPPPARAGEAVTRRQDIRDLLARAHAMLSANRPLGIAFRQVRHLDNQRYVPSAEIEIDNATPAEQAVAEVLDAVGSTLIPPPRRQSIEALFAAGLPPDRIYNGPRSKTGHVTQEAPAPRRTITKAEILAAIQRVEAVQQVYKLDLSAREARTATDLTASDLGQTPNDADRFRDLTIYRNGEMVVPDRDEVLARVYDLEQRRRWAALYDENVVPEVLYGRLPMGNARRNLARYRSIQHLFPQTYGLGRYGTSDFVSTDPGHRAGEVRQLRGYLLLFEQPLADYLAQLNSLARLFSFTEFDQSYFTQPVAHLPAEEDDPPDIAPVLGAGRSKTWHATYRKGLERAAAAHDPFRDRHNRALDHMLSRFGESLDTDRLLRQYQAAGMSEAQSMEICIAQKRAFLAHCVELGENRARGPNLDDLAETALQKRVRLKTGLGDRFLIVEHALLGGPRGDAAAIAAVSLAAGRSRLTAVLPAPIPAAAWPRMRAYIARARTDAGAYRILPMPDYTLALRMILPDGSDLYLVERFPSQAEARRGISMLVADDTEPEPAFYPVDFFGPRLSVFLKTAPETDTCAFRNFTETTLGDCLPTHLGAMLFWTNLEDYDLIEADYRRWIEADRAHPEAMIDHLARHACSAFRKDMAPYLAGGQA